MSWTAPRRAAWLAMILCGPGLAGGGEGKVAPAQNDLIIGVDPVPIVAKVVGDAKPFKSRGVNRSQGANAAACYYWFGDDKKPVHVGVGIYPTTEDARKAYAMDLNRCSVDGLEVQGIGDESSGHMGNLRFRRANVCAAVHAPDEETCLKIGRALDEALQKTCPRAASVPVPEVVKVNLPERVEAGRTFTCRLEVREKDADSGLVIDGGWVRGEPRTVYDVEVLAGEAGTTKHEIFLVTRKNIIAKVVLEVTVVEARKP